MNSWTYVLMQIKKVFGDHLPIIMMMKPGMFVRYIATTTVGMLEWVQTPPGQNLEYPCLCPLLFLLWAFDKCPRDTPELQIHQDFVHWSALLCSHDDQHRLHGVYPLHHWFGYGFASVMHGDRFPFLPVFWSMKAIKTMSNRQRNSLLWRVYLRPLKKQICCTSMVLVLHSPLPWCTHRSNTKRRQHRRLCVPLPDPWLLMLKLDPCGITWGKGPYVAALDYPPSCNPLHESAGRCEPFGVALGRRWTNHFLQQPYSHGQ